MAAVEDSDYMLIIVICGLHNLGELCQGDTGIERLSIDCDYMGGMADYSSMTSEIEE
jgi:hypothetical protein